MNTQSNQCADGEEAENAASKAYASVMAGHQRTAIILNDSPLEVLSTKAMQLRAVLNTLYGEPGEVFRRQSDAQQDEVLWLCAMLADEVVLLIDAQDKVTRNADKRPDDLLAGVHAAVMD